MSRNKPSDSGIEGQFAPHLIEMLKSPAFRVLSQAALRILHRLAIEWASHGGTLSIGDLTITFDQLVEYGLSRRMIAPAMRELAALGFLVVTQKGIAGNADFRRPTKVRVTWLPKADAKATHDWRQITEDDADMIAKAARRRGRNSAVTPPGKNRFPVSQSEPSLGAQSEPNLGAQSEPKSVHKVNRNPGSQSALPIENSPSTALRAEPAVRAEAEPAGPEMAMAAMTEVLAPFPSGVLRRRRNRLLSMTMLNDLSHLTGGL